MEMVKVYYLGGFVKPEKPSFNITVGENVLKVKNEFGAVIEVPRPFVQDLLVTNWIANKQGMFRVFTDNPKVLAAAKAAREGKGKKPEPAKQEKLSKEQLLEQLAAYGVNIDQSGGKPQAKEK